MFVVGYIGWLIRGNGPSRDVRVSTAFTGTVTLVGNRGTSGCIEPDSGGATICSGFYTEVGSRSPKVGQKVHAAEEWAKTVDGGYGNLLLIYTPTA